MKKLLTVVLIGCLVLSLMACGAKEETLKEAVSTPEITQTAEIDLESTETEAELNTENIKEATPTEEQPEIKKDTDPYADRVYVGEYQGRTLVIKSVNSDGNPTMITVDGKEYEINENGEFVLEEGNSGCILSNEAVRDENGLITGFEIKFAFGDTYILSEDINGE